MVIFLYICAEMVYCLSINYLYIVQKWGIPYLDVGFMWVRSDFSTLLLAILTKVCTFCFRIDPFGRKFRTRIRKISPVQND